MLLTDLREGEAQVRLNKLNTLLDELYGLQIDYSNSTDDLMQVYEHYRDMRVSLLREGCDQNPQYAKAVLISEAVLLYLREIAPKRRKKRKATRRK